MGKQYTLSKTLISEDVDFTGRLSPCATFLLMQQVAVDHAESLGLGHEDMQKQHALWVLLRARVEMKTHPCIGQTVHITTWPGTPMRTLYPRHFHFNDDQGALIGVATTLWTIIDTREHTMIPVGKLALPVPDTREIPAPLPVPGKLDLSLRTLPYTAVRRVSYSDLDLNSHMNNTRYVQWVLDVLPAACFTNGPLKKLQLSYLSEALMGENLSLAYDYTGLGFCMRGTRQDGSAVFEAQGEFGEKEQEGQP